MTQTASKDPFQIAARFVAARLEAKALPQYPGAAPADLASAYKVQDAAIDQWPDQIAGWKIGLVGEPLRARYGAARIAGPIFRTQVQIANGAGVDLPVIAGGFAAVEAEFVLRIGQAPPAHKARWSAEEASEYADAMFIGVEFAGSPFAGINDMGPAVTASDFGNNSGLVLGHEIANWRALAPSDLTAETYIDGALIGRGSASAVPGGPFAALAFILQHCHERGRLPAAGVLISTGATTGVHEIKAGQSARMIFGGFGEIQCRAVDAKSVAARAGAA